MSIADSTMEVREKSYKAQIAVYYSDLRKAEMKLHGEKNCSALFTLMKDIIQRHAVEIENVDIPASSDRKVDFIIKVGAQTPKALEELKEELLQVRAGVKKITFFPIA